MKTKTLRISEDISRAIAYRAKREDVEESDAMRQLIKLGAIEYAIQLYRDRKITLREAARIANLDLRRMLDALMEHGIRGNVTLEQQKKSLALVKSLK